MRQRLVSSLIWYLGRYLGGFRGEGCWDFGE